MDVDIKFSAKRVAAATQAGRWGGKILPDHFDAACRARPGRVAVTGCNSSGTRTGAL